jgi:hypothetical protein
VWAKGAVEDSKKSLHTLITELEKFRKIIYMEIPALIVSIQDNTSPLSFYY